MHINCLGVINVLRVIGKRMAHIFMTKRSSFIKTYSSKSSSNVNSSLTVSSSLPKAAKCNAVSPLLSLAETSIPLESRLSLSYNFRFPVIRNHLPEYKVPYAIRFSVDRVGQVCRA